MTKQDVFGMTKTEGVRNDKQKAFGMTKQKPIIPE